MFHISHILIVVLVSKNGFAGNKLHRGDIPSNKENFPGKIEETSNDNSRKVIGNGSSTNYYFPEFNQIALFLQPLTKQVVNQKCRKQLETYVRSLKNSSLWAVQMFDASAKIPQGLLTSDAYDLGNYDGCIEINLRRDEEDNIWGKYCLATLTMTEKDMGSQDVDVFMSPGASIWEKMTVPIFKYGFINDVFRSAMCVPNECTSKDVRNILMHLYKNVSKINRWNMKISIGENSCSTKEVKKSTTESILIKLTIMNVFILVASATIVDLLGWCSKSSNASFLSRILICFSAHRNVKLLTPTSRVGHLTVLDSLKVYVMILYVITRRLSFLIDGPIINRKTADQAFDRPFKEYFFDVSNHLVAFTFLVLAGYLHFYKVYGYFQKNPELTMRRIYIVQFLKAIPLYILAIVFYAYVFQDVGDGPMWKERTENSIQNCKKHWMFNLLHLNNFIHANKMCIFESWHFAVIAHYFITIPIVVRIAMRSSTAGFFILGFLTTTTLALPFGKICYDFNLFSNLKNDNGYVQWHQRMRTGTLDLALAYYIGVSSSLVHTKLTDNKLHISDVCVKIFSFLAAVFCLAFFSMPFVFKFEEHKILPNLVINTIRQLFWSLAISWIIIGVSTKKLTILMPIFAQKYFFPLSRLTYPYLLSLGFVQLYTNGTVRTLDYLSFSRLIWMSTSDSVAAYIFAVILYLLIHRPISNVLNEILLKEPQKNGKFEEHSKRVKEHLKFKKKN